MLKKTKTEAERARDKRLTPASHNWGDATRTALRSAVDGICDALDELESANDEIRRSVDCADLDEEGFADRAPHWAVASSTALDNAGRELVAAIELLPDDHGYLPRREEPQKLQEEGKVIEIPRAGIITCPCGRRHEVRVGTEETRCPCGRIVRWMAPDNMLTPLDMLAAMSASVQRNSDGRWYATGRWGQDPNVFAEGDSPSEAIAILWKRWAALGHPKWRFA